jgi:TPR repeat protein
MQPYLGRANTTARPGPGQLTTCLSLIRMAAVVILLLSARQSAAADDFRSGLSAYNSGDYVAAFRDWLTLAERGDASAQAGIGFLFHKGLGVSQDDVEAAYWFEKAAEQNQAEAQLLLGTLFFFGNGVPQNYVMAFAWCEIAESNGQSDALECRDAALEHMTGAEMKQSSGLVTEWLERHPHARP